MLPFFGIALLTSEKLSDNGKAGRTGSPGETTCTNCHSSYPLNSGGGSVAFLSPGMTGFQYTPGQTYNMSVTVSRSGNNLFGIGLEALTSANDNGGTLTVTDAGSTSIKNSTVSGVSRRNLVHTLNGGSGTGSKVFNFSWTAPVAGTGNVTFYYAGAATNSNGSESGDYIYSGSQVVSEVTCAPPAQPGTITGNTAACAGTSVNYSIAAVTGATGYTWTLPNGWTGTSTSTGITVVAGSSSGNISVTANGACGSSPAKTLAVSGGNFTASTNVTNISCNGMSNGSATAVANGSTGTLTYSWSPSGGTSATAANLAAGNYTVTISDNSGCTATTSATVIEPYVLAASAGNNLSTCAGSGVVLGGSPSASGGTSPYTYLWDHTTELSSASIANPTASPAANTSYTLLVTDAHGCTSTSVVAVSIGTSLTPVINLVGNTLQASITGTSYEWYFNGALITGASTSSYTPTISGDYEVVVYDGTGCFGVSPVFNFVSVGINDIAFDNSFSIYPNPANNFMRVDAGQVKSNSVIHLYDLSGRLVLESQLNQQINIIDLSLLENGVYLAALERSSERKTTRLLINHK